MGTLCRWATLHLFSTHPQCSLRGAGDLTQQTLHYEELTGLPRVTRYAKGSKVTIGFEELLAQDRK